MDHASLHRYMDLLGVTHGDSPETVRLAWRAAVRKLASSRADEAELAQLNTAYQALRRGVPADRSARPESSTKADPGDIASTSLSPEVRAILRKAGAEVVARGEVVSNRRRGLIERMLRRPVPLHVPAGFRRVAGQIDILLDTPSLTPGYNHIALPELALENDRIRATGQVRVIEITAGDADGHLRFEAQPQLGSLLLPGRTRSTRFSFSTG